MGSDNLPPGWSAYWTLFNLGSPPPDQYLWEMILEVGQVALHRFSSRTLAEGTANVAFTVHNIGVGLSADQIRKAMRPQMQAQRHLLSKRLLGDYHKNNGAVDFYYRRGTDNKPYLFFVAPTDPRSTSTYAYRDPGFFSDAALTQKLSTKQPGTSGDSEHEKLSIQQGETTVYVGDDQEGVYRLRIVAGEDLTQIQVFASERVR